MAEPRTLMQMAGAPQTPHPLAASAVVMIDAQNEYLSGGLPLTGIERAFDEGARDGRSVAVRHLRRSHHDHQAHGQPAQLTGRVAP